MSEPNRPEPKKPTHVAKVGNVRVAVRTYGDGRFIIIWRKTAGGERIRETFTEKRKAVIRAEEIAKSIADSLADVVTLSSADRDNYRLAIQALAPTGIPLHAAISEYVAARNLIPGHTLLEAAGFFARDHIERRAVPASAVVLEQLLAKLRDDRRDERRYIAPLKRDLERFTRYCADLNDATEESVREYLRTLRTSKATRDKATGEMIPKGAPVSARRRDNVRDAIVSLMRFAREKEYLPPDKTSAAERIVRISEGGEITTYSPEQLAEILHYFATQDRDWLPWAATQAFAGPRTSEIFRLQWSAYKWPNSAIAISSKVARKVRISRQAPILTPLVEWLADWHDATGFVIPRKWKDLEAAHSDALARLRKALNWVVWDTNALRHSFGSNRLAIVKSEAQVALEMGNSPAQVREHYNDPKPEAEAVKYFAVLPPRSVRNMVRFKAAK